MSAWDDEQIIERLSEWCQSHGIDTTASGRNAAASILFFLDCRGYSIVPTDEDHE